MGLPKVKMGQERCWSAAGACKLAQGNVSPRSSKVEPRPLLRVQLGRSLDGCP